MTLAVIILAAPTPTTPPPGSGFQFHKPAPDGSWFGPLVNLFNVAADNLAYIVLGLCGLFFLIGLALTLVGFGSGNRTRGMHGVVAMVASLGVIIALGTYTNVLQGIGNSSTS